MYYVFNCAVAFDAVLIEPSGIHWQVYEEIDRPYVNLPTSKPVTLSTPRIGSHHLWIGLYLRPNGYGVFCGDAFQKQLKKRKIRFLDQVHCPELDIPWRAEDNIQPALDWEAKHGEPLGARLKMRAEILKLRGKPEL